MLTSELSHEQFFRDASDKIKRQVETGLSLRGRLTTNDRGNVMEIPIAGIRGCHYEIGFHKDCHEIALHFQGTAQNNLSRLNGFRPHVSELESRLRHPLILGPHEGKGRQRLWIKLPLRPCTQDLLEKYSDLTARLIIETLPILQSILNQEHQSYTS